MYYTNQTQQEPHSLSIVMPVYNEEGVIEKVVRDFCDTVLNRFKKPQFVLVNDCSNDATSSILEKLKNEYPYIKIMHHAHNQGHGPSLLDAYHLANGEYVFHCDSDNQFRAEDFWLLWKKMQNDNLDVVMGWRKKRNDPVHRIYMSRAVRLFTEVVFGISNRDINAPFKLYKRGALEKVLRVVPRNAVFPTILMILATHKNDFRIGQLPVQHLPRLTGRSFFRSWKIIGLGWIAIKEIISFKRKMASLP